MKFAELFGSRRFWILTVGALAAIGSAWAGDVLSLQVVADTIVIWAGAIVAVGTADKLGSK